MPRQDDYIAIRQMVQADTGQKVNEYLATANNFITNSNYSYEQLTQSAEMQIDKSTEVIETGETFFGQTEQGNIEITPENAEQIKEEGLWSFISILAHRSIKEEDFYRTIENATIRVTIEDFISKASEGTVVGIKGLDTTPAEEPEEEEAPAEEPEAKAPEEPEDPIKSLTDAQIKKAIKQHYLFELYDALVRNKQKVIDDLNKNYGLDKLENASQGMKFVFNQEYMMSSIDNQLDIFLKYRLNEMKNKNDLNLIAESLKIMYLFLRLRKNYIVIDESTVFNISDKHNLKYEVIEMYNVLVPIFYAQGRIKELNKVAFANFSDAQAKEVTDLVISYAIKEENRDVKELFLAFPKFEEAIEKYETLVELKQKLNAEKRLVNKSWVVLKGW